MQHNIQPLLNKQYLKAKKAKGVYIYDENDKAYLDGSSGAVTCSIGHSHPKLLPFIKQQLDKLQYVYRSQFGSAEAENLALKLCQLSPNQIYKHTFFVNSGSEAIETAMKTAIQYWQENNQPTKQHFITRWKSYHGITSGALSLSGHPLRRSRFENGLEKYPALFADLEKDTVKKQCAEFVRVIETIGAQHIAAFVAEPIVGAAGTALTPHPEYYAKMKAICQEYDLLFIADEVMTGLGRTGKWFGLDHWGVTADIVAIGKSLGAGYAPIAATLMTEKILNPIKQGSGLIMSGHTYSGHPLSCYTALKVLEIIESDQLLENVNKMGAFIKNGLKDFKKKYAFIHEVRGEGLLMGMEFDPSLKGLQANFIEDCYREGLLIYPSVGGSLGKDENGVLISPPFIIKKEEAAFLLKKMDMVLQRLSKSKKD